ncbi:ABC transporter permease [Nocardia transvalensis]|uniref:ABC transporter permease n=1 Tax=Nocardia transvalensis TaxID=37333 RepID=UPI00189544D6|nr:ABC transporter permease [Nocardia transvalensis]MBF6329807.1 ABC transporter permease [Nocardia transvalensis]
MTVSSKASQSTVDGKVPVGLLVAERPPKAGAFAATVVFGWRALLKIRRSPEQLTDVIVMPLTSTLLFTFLLGGAIAGSTTEYLQFYLPGVMVMAVCIATVHTGLHLNRDIATGMFDRVRTLPIWRLSVLVGAIGGDLIRYLVAALVPLVVGLALGFRPDAGVGGMVVAVLMLLVFAFCFAWFWTFLATALPTPSSVQSLSWMLIFVLMFCSNLFVPQQTMPGWLETVVAVNPISHMATAVRGIAHGTATAGDIGMGFLVCAVLTAVFGSLTLYRYYRRR